MVNIYDQVAIRPEPWTQSALCAQSDPEEWFPLKGNQGQEALRICNGRQPEDACPVRADCLAYALRHRERIGIWGGRTTPQRMQLENRRNGDIRQCFICRVDFAGVQGQVYCSQDCQREARRRRARSAS